METKVQVPRFGVDGPGEPFRVDITLPQPTRAEAAATMLAIQLMLVGGFSSRLLDPNPQMMRGVG